MATAAPRKPAKRAQARKGHGPAKARVIHASTDETTEQPSVETVDGVWPADPEDPRLTLAGVVLGPDGNIEVEAYKDLMPCFAAEPAPDQHPHPENPGVREQEKIPKGLSIWDDVRAGAKEKDGAGWKARRAGTQHEPSREKWFNIRTCGSWRMAFLFASLQRLKWDERAAWLKAEITTPSGHESKTETPPPSSARRVAADASPAPETAKEEEKTAPSKNEALDTPKGKRARSAAEGRSVQKKRSRQNEQQDTKPSETIVQQAAVKTKLIDPSALTTSVRLQQILAARQQKQ